MSEEQFDTWATVSFDPRPGPGVFVQWKGTEVCLDFTCKCGSTGHFDGAFAYGLRCADCGAEWQMPHSFGLLPGPDGVVQDTDMPHRAGRVTDVAFAEVSDESQATGPSTPDRRGAPSDTPSSPSQT